MPDAAPDERQPDSRAAASRGRPRAPQSNSPPNCPSPGRSPINYVGVYAIQTLVVSWHTARPPQPSPAMYPRRLHPNVHEASVVARVTIETTPSGIRFRRPRLYPSLV